MNVAPRLQDCLAAQHSVYELLCHPRTGSSTATAQAAHVPGRRVAKAVVVKDAGGYLLAVLPSTHHIALSQLGRELHRGELRLAAEPELERLFPDCDVGALPPLGGPYGLPMVVEEDLDRQPEVFFEAGDHEHLVHMTQAEFMRLTCNAQRAHFSRIDPGLSRLAGGDTC